MSNGTPLTPPEGRSPTFVQASQRNNREMWFRVSILLAFVGSLALVWWTSSQVLAPRLAQSRELSSNVARLSSQVDDLERKWKKSDAERLREKFEQVHSLLFANQSVIETWLNTLKDQVGPLALELKTDIGKPSPLATNEVKVSVLSTVISIDVQPTPGFEGVQSSYQRIVQLTHHLAAQERRADLIDLTVMAGTNSISRATGTVNFWAGEDPPR
jgi:cytoskeletal protein RodZ